MGSAEFAENVKKMKNITTVEATANSQVSYKKSLNKAR